MTLSSRSKFVLMFIFFSIPITASYLTFFFWQPGATNNFGELITPVIALPQQRLTFDDGADAPRAAADVALRGKWLLMTVDRGECDAACRKKMYAIRQVRQILGRDQDRVARVALLTDASRPDQRARRDYAGTAWVQASESVWLRLLPVNDGSSPHDYIYAVDPMGNLFMRYRADADIKHIVADFKRVLKASQLGKEFEGKAATNER